MKLNNAVYNVLKWIALIALPAMGTFYFALAGIWGFPYAEQIVGTIAAIDTCLGTILGISTYNFNKKVEDEDEDEDDIDETPNYFE